MTTADLRTHGSAAAAHPVNEPQRMAALRRYHVLDTASEQAFDDLASLASAICRSPMAAITLVDSERQWFKSRIGLVPAETPREIAFCAHAILQPDQLFEVPDATQDARFARNPLVTGDPGIRFYAGAPLLTPDGLPIGTVCVMDRTPRQLSHTESDALQLLARQVVAQLELRQAVAGLELEGMTDGLTGAWNRRAFDRRMREEWVAHAQGRRELALVMVDLDHFKRINDDFGHPAGDAVLQRVARIARDAVRPQDMVARFGGEEFALVLPNASLDDARGVAEQLRLALQDADWPDRPVTASLGVAVAVPADGGAPPGLLARADRALYRAKAGGRNRIAAFTDWA